MARPRLARRGSALERRLGAILRDRELWEQALTHRSYAYERGGLPTNERLEFLGDAVLGIVVTDQLYKEFPNQPEGDLAKRRAALLNMTESGPDHAKRFKAVVSLSGISYGSGAGRSKKEAEQAAARVAVERLRSGALQKPVAAEHEEM